MTYVNGFVGVLIGGVLAPFRDLHPLAGIAVMSLLTALLVLGVMKFTSNQSGIERVKRQMEACVYEIRLYNDDLAAILRAQWRFLGHNIRYLGLSLVPALWVMPVLMPVLFHLESYYGYRGLKVGERTLLQVEVDESAAGAGKRPELTIQFPEGLQPDTPAVWIPSLHRMDWRVLAVKEGTFDLSIRAPGSSGTLTKTVVVSERLGKLSPRRIGPGFWNALRYPAEPPLPPGSGVRAVALVYPERTFGGWSWLWILFGLSFVLAFALKGVMGVTM